MYRLVASTEPLTSTKYSNKFVCEIELMEGDADGWETLEIKVTDKNITAFETLMQSIKNLNVNGYYKNIQKIKGWKKFFGENAVDPWPYQCEGEFPYAYESHSYYYYDAKGVKYSATLEKLEDKS